MERAAQAVDVGAMIDGVRVVLLLGRHVIEGVPVLLAFNAPRDELADRAPCAGHTGRAQVEHADGARPIEHKVARLDVAMDDSLSVSGLELAGCLDQRIDGLCHPHRPAVSDDAAEVEFLGRLLAEFITGGHPEVSQAAPSRAFTTGGSNAAGGSVRLRPTQFFIQAHHTVLKRITFATIRETLSETRGAPNPVPCTDLLIMQDD
jgi:hypothetical protein